MGNFISKPNVKASRYARREKIVTVKFPSLVVVLAVNFPKFLKNRNVKAPRTVINLLPIDYWLNSKFLERF